MRRSSALLTRAIGAAAGVWAARHVTSEAVRAWYPSSLEGAQRSQLYARAGGTGDRAVFLLHGLISSGDVFGAGFDRIATKDRVVVPDLLGFGRSLNERRDTFTADEHLDALDQLAFDLGVLPHGRITVGAHSMGSALALRWAARHPERVDRLVCWGAPIFSSPAAARDRISGSAMTRLFALDTNWARRACAVSCQHRTAASWLAAVSQPRLPIQIARSASLHTWPAYRDAMRDFVIEAPWIHLLDQLDGCGTRVELSWGTDDPIGDHSYVAWAIRQHHFTTITTIGGADHHLPMTHPAVCVAQLIGDTTPQAG